jgi:hypothetical protein
MNRRLVPGLALAAGVVTAACTERPQEQSLQGPSSTAAVIPAACDPNAFNSLINNYFSATKAQEVRRYKDAMIAALSADPAQSETAKDQGFNILREIGLAARAATQPSASTGSQRAAEVRECIYPSLSNTDVIKSPPGPTFFVNALTRDGGGFDVRGGQNDPTGPVQAFGGSPLVVISGVAPQTTSTWDESLTGRVLFYGEPGSTSGYHWDVVPRAAEFSPELVFTTCVDDQPDPEVPGDPTLMLTESGVGVLGFLPADHVGCGISFAPISAGRFNLLHHLASLGRTLFIPEPAAAAAVMPGVVGGSAKGAKSHFDVGQVSTLSVNFVAGKTPPTPDIFGTYPATTFPVAATISATVNSLPQPVFGTCVYLTGRNNNGAPTQLRSTTVGQHEDCTSPPGGDRKALSVLAAPNTSTTSIADFGQVGVTKTGRITITVTADVLDRAGFGAISVTSNVKPASR